MKSRMSKIAALIVCFATLARAQEIKAAAAADLQFVFQEVAARFEKQTGNKVTASFGSSGNFFSQIQNGAPFDLFFSADAEYPEKLEAAGLTEPGTMQQYARGKIVLWTTNDSGVDISRGLGVLLEPAVKKIAVANPAHAPYGRAAVAALKSAGIYDKISDKLIYGENISQAAQFAATGNAQAGIIALSLAVSPTMKDAGKYSLISEDSYPKLDQVGVVLKSSKKKDVARCFMEFIRGAEISDLMKQYGFDLPPNAVAEDKTGMQKACSCCGSAKPAAN